MPVLQEQHRYRYCRRRRRQTTRVVLEAAEPEETEAAEAAENAEIEAAEIEAAAVAFAAGLRRALASPPSAFSSSGPSGFAWARPILMMMMPRMTSVLRVPSSVCVVFLFSRLPSPPKMAFLK